MDFFSTVTGLNGQYLFLCSTTKVTANNWEQHFLSL